MARRFSLLIFALLFLLPFDIRSAPVSSLLIVQNVGQYPSSVRYVVLGNGVSLWAADNNLWASSTDNTFQITFPGVNAHPQLEPSQPRNTNISYYQGKDPNQWYEHIPVYSSLRYSSLVPGIDLEISGQDGDITFYTSTRLEIEISSEGVTKHTVFLQPDQPTPLKQILSLTDAAETPPPQSTSPDGSPLLFGTFLGSNGLDQAHAIKADELGRIYLAGQMLPVVNFINPDVNSLHAVEAFIARFTPDGSDVEYLTIILGDVEDWGLDIAISSTFEAYFTGRTDSTNFPTTPGAYDTDENGSFDAYLMKFGADGTLSYSTLLGKSQWDTAYGVAVDAAGNAYITGDTQSTDFPTTSDAFDGIMDGPRDVYIAKFNPDGSQLLYSTFLGGDNIERGEAIAVPAENVVYLTGWTSSSNFPISPNAYDTSYNNGVDAFAVKLTLGNPTLTYGTFLGGSVEDRSFALALDGTGNAYLAGLTTSGDFPANGYDTTYAGGPPACDGLLCPDAFAARLSADGQTLNYATYLGDTDWDQANGIAVDFAGNVYLTGEVNSGNFPVSGDAYDNSLTGGRDTFLTIFNNTFNSLVYSTFLGGIGYETGYSIALGVNGGIFVGGTTDSSDFPTTAGAYNTTINGDFDGFAVLFSLPINPYLTPTPTLPTTGTPPTSIPSTTPTISPTPTITPTPTLTPTPTVLWNFYLPLLHRVP